MVTYQFDVDDDLWREWKNTVPRDKSLDTRIRELIKADADGRVRCPNADDALREISGRGQTRGGEAPAPDDPQPDGASSEIVDAAATENKWARNHDAEKVEEMRAAGRAALDALRAGQRLTPSEMQEQIQPDYPVREQDKPDTWYRKSVQPVLDEAEGRGLVKQSTGDWEWRWAGDNE